MCIGVVSKYLRTCGIVLCVALVSAGVAFGQASSTINGRVLDQADAVLPGVTVTITNQNTGVVRTTVSNGEGLYFLPGLEPGVYNVQSELPGFQTSMRQDVTLGVNATISIDFKLGLAGLNEAVTVTGDAPLIEVTQSKVASSIEATELQNLPMITRNVSGMLALLPGAVPIAPAHRSKENVGSVSLADRRGHQRDPDGRRRRQPRQPVRRSADHLFDRGLEQFQLATSQFNAADGRTGGAALTMVTKSGTNLFHGSAFAFGRDDALTAKDYFTARRESRQGAVQPPAVRRIGRRPHPAQPRVLLRVDRTDPRGLARHGAAEPVRPEAAAGRRDERGPGTGGAGQPQPSARGRAAGAPPVDHGQVNMQLTNEHALMFRYAGQTDTRNAATFVAANDLREPENTEVTMWSTVVQHNWVMSNRGLNQLTAQVNHLHRLGDSVSNITGEHYTRDFPNVASSRRDWHSPRSTPAPAARPGRSPTRYLIQIKDEVSAQAGTHSVKFGGNYNSLPDIGIC